MGYCSCCGQFGVFIGKRLLYSSYLETLCRYCVSQECYDRSKHPTHRTAQELADHPDTRPAKYRDAFEEAQRQKQAYRQGQFPGQVPAYIQGQSPQPQFQGQMPAYIQPQPQIQRQEQEIHGRHRFAPRNIFQGWH